MSRRLLRRRSRSRGQALVEFALVAPILFLLAIGVFETGRLVFYYHTLNNATREGARFAIVHGARAWDGCPSGPTPPGYTSCDPAGDNIKARIVAASRGLDPSAINYGWAGDSSFPIYSPLPNNHWDNDVTIRLEYNYSPILLSDIFGTITLRAETTLVINN